MNHSLRGGWAVFMALAVVSGTVWIGMGEAAEQEGAGAATQPAATQPEKEAGEAAAEKVRPRVIQEVFYYDVMTGKLFPAAVELYPPINTPDKSMLPNGIPAGVKANVFSCGKCKESEWYIGYLEIYLPQAKEAQVRLNKEMEEYARMDPEARKKDHEKAKNGEKSLGIGPTPQEMMLISEGHLVARYEMIDKWFKQESPEGAALVNAAMKKCASGKYPIQCFPESNGVRPGI